MPCFIFTYVLYALDIGICIYGLAEANKIFEGLANTECSALKFFDQVLYGETKQTLPRWAGINNINQILYDLNTTLNTLQRDSYNGLYNSLGDITDAQNDFVTAMYETSEKFYNYQGTPPQYINTSYIMSGYSGTTSYPLSGDYLYDTVYNLGLYDSGTGKYTTGSYFYWWDIEYSSIADNGFDYLTTARNSFIDIFYN